jgi:hypothetical protein
VDGGTRGMRQALNQADTSIQSFRRATGRALQEVDLSFARVRRTAETAMRALGVVAPSLAIGLSLQELARGALDATREFADLADTADRLGVTTDFFQGLRFAVEATGGEVRAAESAISEFGETLLETRGGAGDLAETLQRLDSEAWRRYKRRARRKRRSRRWPGRAASRRGVGHPGARRTRDPGRGKRGCAGIDAGQY